MLGRIITNVDAATVVLRDELAPVAAIQTAILHGELLNRSDAATSTLELEARMTLVRVKYGPHVVLE